jgi:hypothetical protein
MVKEIIGKRNDFTIKLWRQGPHVPQDNRKVPGKRRVKSPSIPLCKRGRPEITPPAFSRWLCPDIF